MQSNTMAIQESVIDVERHNCCLDHEKCWIYKAFEMEEMEISLVYKAFETVYWIIKEEVANEV